ncbi:putative Armadillo repeat-containing protein [Hibiscus syriacus]|uniref:Armadillo repeat-containing protein n=1 Tax=Hibiscus syriacus TaxID=106335 RepID=A0A6A3D6A3_HIBSY|nr:putative Armadillo repeat-containing protein [Hibiscus syriacus]
MSPASNGVPASAYDPLLGTFHTIETVPSSSASPLQSNGRFRNLDETDEHLRGSLGAGLEYDSISNNGSWSGESEEHKEKASNLPELHERCSGYLMSRKLEALAQQLVAMGFSHDRTTMALIFNEGKVEESFGMTFEGSEEEAVKHEESTIGGGNLKIDISEELARIADMEIRYKCTKQEVERAVVAAEGDLETAAESLRSLKQDPHVPPKLEETCDPPTASNNKLSVSGSQNISIRPKPNLFTATRQRNEKDFNYAKAAVTVRSSSELVSKSFQPLKRIQPKLEWSKPQQSAVPAEKRWPNSGSNTSVSYSLVSPLQTSPPAKTESRNLTVESDFKKFQPSIREPVIMMQLPQSVNTKHVPATSISSSPPGLTPFIARNHSSNNLSSNQMHHHLYHPQQQQFTGSSSPGDSPGVSRGNSLWSRTCASPTLAAASSLDFSLVRVLRIHQELLPQLTGLFNIHLYLQSAASSLAIKLHNADFPIQNIADIPGIGSRDRVHSGIFISCAFQQPENGQFG